jgi:hypothetical protein
MCCSTCRLAGVPPAQLRDKCPKVLNKIKAGVAMVVKQRRVPLRDREDLRDCLLLLESPADLPFNWSNGGRLRKHTGQLLGVPAGAVAKIDFMSYAKVGQMVVIRAESNSMWPGHRYYIAQVLEPPTKEGGSYRIHWWHSPEVSCIAKRALSLSFAYDPYLRGVHC